MEKKSSNFGCLCKSKKKYFSLYFDTKNSALELNFVSQNEIFSVKKVFCNGFWLDLATNIRYAILMHIERKFSKLKC